MSFPTTLDDLDASRGASTDKMDNPSHTTHHENEDTLIEAIQAKLGIDDSGVATSIDYIVKNSGSVNPGHLHTETSVTVTKSIQMVCFDFATDVSTGDGKFYFHVPESLNGMNLVAVHAEVITAGTTGTTDIQIYNVTQTVDMLSTKITIDSGETGSDTAVTPPVIDTDNDDVAENDLLRVDVDAVSTTAPKGLIVTLEFEKP